LIKTYLPIIIYFVYIFSKFKILIKNLKITELFKNKMGFFIANSSN